MAKLKLELRGTELIIILMLTVLLLLELLILYSLVYFTYLPLFLSIFIGTLKVLSLFFLGINIIFLLLVIFLRDKYLVIDSWRTYLRESVKFSIVSFIVAIVSIAVSTFMGVLILIPLRKVYTIPAIAEIIQTIRHWIATHTY